MFKLLYPKFWHTNSIVSYILWPLSQIYRLATFFRHFFANPIKLPAKVICVGNITVGGTGKTQLVIWLAKFFTAHNISFVIINKAYAGRLKSGAVLVDDSHTYLDVGDEAIMLRKYGSVIATRKPQSQQSLDLINLLAPQVIIVDDGLQNPNFHKDLKFLMIDANRMFGNNMLLPAGPLRQYPSAVKNIEAIFLVLTEQAQSKQEKVEELKSLWPNSHIVPTTLVPVTKLDATQKYLAFCGIGDPERFFKLLRLQDLNLVETRIFPDHHNYTAEDIEELLELAEKKEAQLITTKKDRVKLPQQYTTIKVLEVKILIQQQIIIEKFLMDFIAS